MEACYFCLQSFCDDSAPVGLADVQLSFLRAKFPPPEQVTPPGEVAEAVALADENGVFVCMRQSA